MKVLLVSESINQFDSGGKVVRYITNILTHANVQVKILVLREKNEIKDDDFISHHDIEFLPIKRNFQNRLFNIFFNTRATISFKELLNNYHPDIVHFASFENSKPSLFILEVKKFGAKLVLQPWTMHFFCAQGFGFRDNKTCTKCVNGNYINALFYKCTGVKSIPSLIERHFLHKRALAANTFLSSNRTFDKILNEYRVPSDNILNFPIPFDCSSQKIETNVNNSLNSIEDYYIYYGQVNDHKGFKILEEVFMRLPSIKFKVLPMNYLSESTFSKHNVEIINNVNWSNGLREYIINSKAVLIPSLWVTSTEYSLCEALLLKKPVILFNIGMHKDIFVNKQNAMVVEPNDVDSYVNAIIELENDSDLCVKLSNNGYKTLTNHNSIEKLTSELMKAYSN